MNELRAFDILLLAANVQATGLVVGAVRSTSDFAVFSRIPTARHPGFEVILSISRTTKIAGGGIDNAVRHFDRVKQIAFDLTQLLVHFVALIGMRESKHFDFRKLMDSVQPP